MRQMHLTDVEQEFQFKTRSAVFDRHDALKVKNDNFTKNK
jgi:hypothetical protein